MKTQCYALDVEQLCFVQMLLKDHGLNWWTTQKEMLDLLYMLMWEQFKSWLNERFTPHRQVLKDSMELLELQQGERPNSLAKCVQKFNANMTFVLINKSLRRN